MKNENRKPLIIFAVVMAIGIILGGTSCKKINEMVSSVMEDPDVADAIVDAVLVETAKETNKTIHLQSNSDVSADSAAALPGRKFMMTYTFLKFSSDELDSEFLDSAMRPELINALKAEAEGKFFRDRKVTLIYVYNGNDGKEACRIELAPGEY